MVAIFPVIGHAGVAEDEPDQIAEARLGANIVRQDHDATLTSLDADHGVGGLAVAAAFVGAVSESIVLFTGSNGREITDNELEEWIESFPIEVPDWNAPGCRPL